MAKRLFFLDREAEITHFLASMEPKNVPNLTFRTGYFIVSNADFVRAKGGLCCFGVI